MQGFLSMVYVSGLLQVNSLSLNRAQCEEFTDYIMLMLKKQPSIEAISYILKT